MALRPFLPSFILILLLTGLSQGRKDARKFIGVSQAESLANIEKGIAYDMDGNIISLRRYGPSGLIEDLSYTYSGNCLSGIDDAVSSSTYVYQSDRNGNVTYYGKNSLSMTYDLNNLIKTVSSQGGQTEYAHLADGTKIWAYDGNTLLAYWGSFVYESRDTVQLESIGYSQGRIVPENGSGGRRTFKNKVYMSDQVGSTRVVLDIDNEESPVVEQNDYLPFGKRAALSGYVTDTTNRYRFNGKEEQAVIGVPYTDYGARLYDTFSARWLSQDPKAENYYGFSPYVFCGGNPVNFIDPDGRDVVISGVLSDEALKQLQSKMQNRITLSRDAESGRISYTLNEGQKLKGDAKRMASMIDNQSIIVNLITTDKNETSTGNLRIGGAFISNTVTTDANGNVSVVANQEVNPNVLSSADAHTNTMGKMMMHEVTEAYAGAQISQKTGVGASPATQTDIANPRSVYNRARNRATSQTPVFRTLYDKSGNVTTDVTQAVRVEWSVTRGSKSKVKQTYP